MSENRKHFNESMDPNKVSIFHNNSQIYVLSNFLNEDNWKEVICNGDENCMFRSIAVHAFGCQSYRAIAREMVIKHLIENKFFFQIL